MRSSCTICSDLFDEINSIAAAPCGHTFHEICLFQWLEHSRTCPECRKHVTQKNVLKLYFNIADVEGGMSADTLKNEVDSLKAKLKLKEMEKKKLKDDAEDLRSFVRKSEAEAEETKQKYHRSQTEVSAMKSQLKQMSKQVSEIEKLRQSNFSLKNQLGHLKNVETIVVGTQKDVEDIIGSCGDGPEAVKQMATYCSLLKRELHNVTDSKQQLRSEIAKLKRDLGCKSAEANENFSKVVQLKEQMQSLEKENESLEKKIQANLADSGQTAFTPKANVVYESPTPERLKRPRLSTEDITVTPVSERILPGAGKKQLKVNVISSETNIFRIPQSSFPSLSFPQLKSASNFKPPPLAEQNSVIRNGYDGFGGHSRFVSRSSPVVAKQKPATKKRQLKVDKSIDYYLSN